MVSQAVRWLRVVPSAWGGPFLDSRQAGTTRLPANAPRDGPRRRGRPTSPPKRRKAPSPGERPAPRQAATPSRRGRNGGYPFGSRDAPRERRRPARRHRRRGRRSPHHRRVRCARAVTGNGRSASLVQLPAGIVTVGVPQVFPHGRPVVPDDQVDSARDPERLVAPGRDGEHPRCWPGQGSTSVQTGRRPRGRSSRQASEAFWKLAAPGLRR